MSGACTLLYCSWVLDVSTVCQELVHFCTAVGTGCEHCVCQELVHFCTAVGTGCEHSEYDETVMMTSVYFFRHQPLVGMGGSRAAVPEGGAWPFLCLDMV